MAQRRCPPAAGLWGVAGRWADERARFGIQRDGYSACTLWGLFLFTAARA